MTSSHAAIAGGVVTVAAIQCKVKLERHGDRASSILAVLDAANFFGGWKITSFSSQSIKKVLQ